jgi:hypothetical protein
LGKSNIYADARRRWEEQQATLHGCSYENGVCTAHGSMTTAETESQLLCTCRSFPNPHRPEEHDTLPSRFPGDTEQRRFEELAGTNWTTQEEREVSSISPEAVEQTLLPELRSSTE